MVMRTPLRDRKRPQVESSHAHLDRSDKTDSGPQSEPTNGVPWRPAMLLFAMLSVLVAVEILLTFGIAKLVTGHAY